ncbi:hypothetical protein [Clostridium sp. ZS2-4]|uniref:hypothetical protein n=1 Tax=Clostridium sp. ZS2-4 TaxID=2987703 RepID=UPI00227BC5A7|nr:hypothetical protein [Clostridium sp. ZS2-4]MCY6356047.1 hypothetical protein [Clostridium sp. ZS2-4]
MLSNKGNYIVKTSKNRFYKFYINNKKLVTEKFIGNQKINQAILDEEILNYSLDIDKYDKIHLIYLTINGALKYTSYPSNNNHMNILTLKNNLSIDTLDIKVLESDIHIFYKTNSLYKNKSLLYHHYFHNNNFLDEEMIEINCPKYVCPYFVDSYKNNIYMLYCNDYDKSQYKIKKFNSFTNLWCDFENNIVIKDANNLNFFVTPNNIGIISYNKAINKNLQTLIIYKDFNTTDSIWSQNICISNNNVNSFKPIIFSKQKYTYVVCKESDSIIYRRSNDLIHWSKEHILNTKQKNIATYAYISNNSNDSIFKINTIYLSCNEALCPIKRSESNYPSHTSNSTDLSIYKLPDADKPLQTNTSAAPEINYDEIINEKDRTIHSINSMNLYLTDQINILNHELNDYEMLLEKLNAEKLLNNQKHNKNISYYERQINTLKSKINESSINTNKKIQSMLKIINEKEFTIQNLYNLINKTK